MACFVYFIFGTAKDVNLGPTAVMSLLTAQFGHSAVKGDATYAIALAFVCGLVQIGMGLLHLGMLLMFSVSSD
jgi:solute carrier family 26 (sodium-independent sulfate anion transporter), member 11